MNTKQLILRPLTELSIVVGIVIVALTLLASAQTFTGTVIDATTKMPSTGDEIVFLDFSSGIQEVNRTQSDSKGRFTLKLDDPKKAGMLRVIHQGTSYYKVVLPGTSKLHFEVYDVSKKLKDIVVTADVMRFQVKEGSLQAVRLFAVQNNSAPPRTQISDHNVEFYLPEGAQIDYYGPQHGRTTGKNFPVATKREESLCLYIPASPW